MGNIDVSFIYEGEQPDITKSISSNYATFAGLIHRLSVAGIRTGRSGCREEKDAICAKEKLYLETAWAYEKLGQYRQRHAAHISLSGEKRPIATQNLKALSSVGLDFISPLRKHQGMHDIPTSCTRSFLCEGERGTGTRLEAREVWRRNSGGRRTER